MRTVLAMVLFLAPPAFAEEKALADCDSQVEIVMRAVDARLAGDGKAKTRRVLRKELDRTAGDMLADFIYSLPEEQLGPEVGKAYKAQCEAM